MNSIHNDPAADLNTRIAGGLCREVICGGMDDEGTAEDIGKLEPFGVEYGIGIAVIAQKRRQISRMLRVGQMIWVIVIAGLIKRQGAVTVFMDMQGIELTAILHGLIGKPVNFHFDQDAAEGNRIEVRDTLKDRMIRIAGQPGIGCGIGIFFHDIFPSAFSLFLSYALSEYGCLLPAEIF